MLHGCVRVLLAVTLLSTVGLNTSRGQDQDADTHGKYNPVLAIGETAPAWKQLPGVDGKQHSLDELDNARAIVVVFTCNSCPYAVDYEDRLIALHQDYRDQHVAVVAINVNKIPADSFDAMKVRAEEKGFSFPYLYDETQQIAKDFGATYTPEFFVLDADRKVRYMGAMDDDSTGKSVKKTYVRDAIDAVLKDEVPTVQETPAVGCRIRIERARRRR